MLGMHVMEMHEDEKGSLKGLKDKILGLIRCLTLEDIESNSMTLISFLKGHKGALPIPKSTHRASTSSSYRKPRRLTNKTLFYSGVHF